MSIRTGLRFSAVMLFAVISGCSHSYQRERQLAMNVKDEITIDSAAAVLDVHDRVVRVALAASLPRTDISGTGAFDVLENGGRRVLVRGNGGEGWRIEQRGRTLRVAGSGSDATPWRSGPFIVRSRSMRAPVVYAGKQYRGELWVSATDSGLLVVNRLPVEDYLRGVVPLELGTRSPRDSSALQAQAVAARSYTYVRVPSTDTEPASGFHMTASIQHQVYGGVAAEHPVVDAAIASTSGMVLRFQGRVVDAPYSSSCGGHTASPDEAWSSGSNVAYLAGVSNINPRTGKPWCDINPNQSWTVSFDRALLSQAVVRHLGARGARGTVAPTVSKIDVERRSRSGRVAVLRVSTDRGTVSLNAHEIRNAFRNAQGVILSSTRFEIEQVGQGTIVFRGSGGGHGVGMCQWGAIGRAREGQSVRTILSHYYPGTVLGFAD